MPLKDAIGFVNSLLRELAIDHFYIGGIAAGAHGEPRATKDADLIIVVEPGNVDRLLDEIETRGLKISQRSDVARKLKEGRPSKILWDKKYSFDLRLSGYLIDRHALPRARDVTSKVYGESLRMASPEDVIVYKLARFEDIDRRDIRKIKEIQENALDWDYIRERTEELAAEIERPKMLENLRLTMGR